MGQEVLTMNIRSFRELRVYSAGMDLVVEVFALTKRFPRDERFSLVDQIRRSSRSVCTNLAEAWRKRRYPAAFVSKLSDAEGEAAETQVHLDIAVRSGHLDPEEAMAVSDRYEAILAQLVVMAEHPEKWTLRPRRPSP
jgi:four helix bundle protein